MMTLEINRNSIYDSTNIFKYNIVNNVYDYKCVDFDKWIINTNKNLDSNNELNYYLIIDLPANDAFAHWVYESAIYLPLFNILKNKYHNIKIHIRSVKDYKKLFFKYFNINEDDITLELKSNNICIFPLPISCLNNIELSDDYINLVNNFILNLNIIKNNNKEYNILLLPRGNKENLVANDRLCNVEDIINNLSIINNNHILYTDDCNNLIEQINIVNNSNNIILVDGSAYLVNGIFCTNSNIIILGNITLSQMLIYKKLQYIHNLILNNNTVVHLPYMNGDYNNSKYYFYNIKNYIK